MRNDITIHPHERVDDLHRDGHLIIQDPKRFCFGVDAVILSGFCEGKKTGENVLDFGHRHRHYSDSSGGKNRRKAFHRIGNPEGECGNGKPQCAFE